MNHFVFGPGEEDDEYIDDTEDSFEYDDSSWYSDDEEDNSWDESDNYSDDEEIDL